MKRVAYTCILVAVGMASSIALAVTLPLPLPLVADNPVGEAVFQHWCAPCHAAGPGHPGTESLQRKYEGKRPATLLDRTDLDAGTVAVFVDRKSTRLNSSH